MRFASEDQRRAVMAQYKGFRAQASRVTQKARKKFQSLPGPVKGIIHGAAWTGALITSTNPKVTHVPRKEIMKRWGPNIAAYAVSPIVGHGIRSRMEGKSIKDSFTKKNARAVSALGLVGLSTFLGERALLHSTSTFVPNRYLGEHALAHSRKISWLLKHGVPLGILASTTYALSKSISKHKSVKQYDKDVKKDIYKGFGVNLVENTIEETLPKTYAMAPRIFNSSLLLGVPAMQIYRDVRRGREFQRRQRYNKSARKQK